MVSFSENKENPIINSTALVRFSTLLREALVDGSINLTSLLFESPRGWENYDGMGKTCDWILWVIDVSLVTRITNRFFVNISHLGTVLRTEVFCIEKSTVSHIVKEIIFPTCPFLWNSWATSLIHQSLTHSPQMLLSRHVMEWNRKESSDRKLGFQSNGGGGHPRDIAFNIYFSECLSKQVQYNFRVQLNKVRLSWTVVHSASTATFIATTNIGGGKSNGKRRPTV